MKKKFRLLAAILTVMIMTVSVLSGCGKSAPTEEDAKKYVQAMLDLFCTGEYDKSVRFVDIEEGKESELIDEIYDGVLASLEEGPGMTDEIKERFRDVIKRAFAASKYSVGDAVKTDDSGEAGYDVTVTIEPLRLFAGASEAVQEEMAALAEDPKKLAGMSEDDFYAAAYDIMLNALSENLDNPTYDAPQEFTVHYGLMDKDENVYGAADEDFARIGEAIFSTDGM